MKTNLSIIALILLLISCSSDDGSPSPVDNTPALVESFGNWSPSFSSQTANFTQSRTGTQGTEQTRTIAVNITTSTITSTEEVLNEDVNQDDDLFDEVETISTTYTASESLGSFETSENNVSKDNDMVLKIGNQSFPLSVGKIEYYGSAEMGNSDIGYYDLNCEGKGLYTFGLKLYTEGNSILTSGEVSGNGDFVWIFLSSENKTNPLSGVYDDQIDRYSSVFNQNFADRNEFFDWENENYESYFEGYDTDDCYVFSLYNLVSNYPEYYISDIGNGEFNFIGGSVIYNLNSDGSHTVELTGGEIRGGLPVSLYFKGFLSSFDYSDDAGKSTSFKRKKKRRFNDKTLWE